MIAREVELLVQIERLRQQVAALTAALTEIADADYRGNRSPESEKAHAALVAAGMRS